jgi:CheY-like chemotaxis protein
MSNRRDAGRVPFTAAVECEHLASGTTHVSARISDISASGVFIDALWAFPIGSRLSLRFDLPSLRMYVMAVVVNSMPPHGMGLRFEGLTDAQRAAIEELLDSGATRRRRAQAAPAADGALRSREEASPSPSRGEAASAEAIEGVARDEPPDATPAVQPGTGRKRVLVVDDHHVTRQLLRTMIEGGGDEFEVVEASDGAKAVGLVREGPPFDLIFLDVVMPNLDGLGACRQIRALGTDTPIVFLTGKGELGDYEAGRAAGADTYLRKPIALVTMRSMLDLFAGGAPSRR